MGGRWPWLMVGLVLLALLFWLARRDARGPDFLSQPLVRIVETREEQLFGRPFLLDVLAGTMPGAAPDLLHVRGDGIVISFSGSTPPFRPTLTGPVIEFGGHRLVVTDHANRYEIDGRPFELPAPGRYLFAQGMWVGEF